MKKLLLCVSLLFAVVSVQANLLIISKTDGCNNFGGHNKAPVVTLLTQWATNIGFITTVVEADNAHYDQLDPSLYCVVALVYVSGDDVVSLAGESAFFKNFGGIVMQIHSSPDAERHHSITSCDPADADTFFSENIVGASLRNGGCNAKHECNGQSRIIYKDANALNDSMTVGIPDSMVLPNVELYNVGPYIKNTYWNPTNEILWRGDSDGQGTENCPPGGCPDVPVLWRTSQGHLCMTLGHFSEITTPGEITYLLMERMFREATRPCLQSFPIEEELIGTTPQPVLDPTEKAYWHQDMLIIPYERFVVMNLHGQTISTQDDGSLLTTKAWPRGVYFVKHPNGHDKIMLR